MQVINAAQATPGPSRTDEQNVRTLFYQQGFAADGPFTGMLTNIFRTFTRTLVTGQDFGIEFYFVKDTWQIRVSPKSTVGKFAIMMLKEVVIRQELEGKS